MSEELYENYPFSTFCLASITSLLNFALGALIFYLIGGTLLGVAYFVIALMSIVPSMRFRCAYCYYYGKRCSTGLGILAGFLFKKRDSGEFNNSKYVTPVAIISFSVLLLPIIAAIIFMLLDFSLNLLLLFLFYFIIAFVSGLLMRKNLICKHCKQGQLGCPAYEGMKGKRG